MRIYVCQICDCESKPVLQNNVEETLELWTVHHLPLKSGEFLQVVTCPDCSSLGPFEIFAGYQKRIREGRDLNFH